MNELRTTLDMGKETYVALKCKQNDDRTLILTLLSNGVTWIPDVDSILELRGKRSDNMIILQTTTDISIVDNIVTIQLNKDFTRVPGVLELELNIRKLTEITTFTFTLTIKPSVIQDGLDGSLTTSTVLEDLTEALQIYNEWLNTGPITIPPYVDMTPPSVISDFVATKGNGEVTLTWVNPPELDLAGVKIVKQINHYPTDVNDGVLIFSGLTTTYIDTAVVKGTTYYYRAFPYDTNMNYNNSTINQQVSATLLDYVIYGVKIDTTNSNPLTSITYTDDAVGFTNATNVNNIFNYGSWADKFPFNLIKPCKLEGGVVRYYMQPNNYTLKPDGSSSYNKYATYGDTMVEFPKIYWKFETVGTDLYIRISNSKVDDGYKCLAHLRGSTEKNNCYISAYMGRYSNYVLMSISGTVIDTNRTLTFYRTLVNEKGYGYDVLGYSQLLMLQILFVMLFKSTDSQNALGRGFVDGNANRTNCGGRDTAGLFYGETLGKAQIKFCGLEDFWGNVSTWIDGIFIDSFEYLYIGNEEFNDGGVGYTNYGSSAEVTEGYIHNIMGYTHAGFIAANSYGTSSTHYCDVGSKTGGSSIFGGYYASGSSSGVFNHTINTSASSSMGTLGCRFMFL